MVVCLCKGVSDKKIRWLVQNGANLKQVVATSRAGSDCGSCICQVKKLVEQSRKELEALSSCCEMKQDATGG